MAKTVLKVRQDGIAYYLNEVSAGASNSCKRYALSRTSQHSGTKDGWVRVNSTECQVLIGIATEPDLFRAFVNMFDGKKQRPHAHHGGIRGLAGKWEGEAFPARVTRSRDASVSMHSENLTIQEE